MSMTDEDADLDEEAVPSPTEPIPTTEPTPTGEREFVGTGLFWGLVIGILLAVAVVILAAQGTGSTTVPSSGSPAHNRFHRLR